MMNKRFLIALLCAVFFGMLSIGIANRVLQRNMEDAASKNQTDVVYALADIQAGTIVSEMMVGVRKELVSNKPEGAFSDPKPVVGRTARFFIPARTTVTKQQLTSEPGIVGMLQPGYRAVAVQVNESSSVAGFISPGTFVDVIAVMQAPGSVTIAKTILQSVRVMATGARIQNGTEITQGPPRAQAFNTVTLEVLPEEAEKLALATRQGSLQLTIRNQNDKDALTSGETIVKVLGQYQPGRSLPAAATTASPRPETRKSTTLPPVFAATPTPTPVATPAPVIEVNVIKGGTPKKYSFPEQSSASSPKGQ